MKLNKEQVKVLTSEAGKYSLDISKLIFGGIILASIMQTETEPTTLLWVGGMITFLFSFIGFLLILLSKKDSKYKADNKRRYIKRGTQKKENI